MIIFRYTSLRVYKIIIYVHAIDTASLKYRSEWERGAPIPLLAHPPTAHPHTPSPPPCPRAISALEASPRWIARGESPFSQLRPAEQALAPPPAQGGCGSQGGRGQELCRLPGWCAHGQEKGDGHWTLES